MAPSTLLLALCSGIASMLGFLFVTAITQADRQANRWLGMFYMCLACTFSQLFLYKAEMSQQLPLLVHLLELPVWATMPCLYLAVLTFTGQRVSNRHLVHFVPAFCFLVYSMLYLMPPLMGIDRPAPRLPFWLVVLIRYFYACQLAFYWILSYLKLSIHRKQLLRVASSIEYVNLNWLKNFLLAVLSMIVIKSIPTQPVSDSVVPLIYFAGMLLLGYYSVRQQTVHHLDLATVNSLKIDQGHMDQSYIQQGYKQAMERLDPEQLEKLQRKVLGLTVEQKLYLDPSLTLPDLSAATGIRVQDLSYVLNKGLKKSFYQFINELRVEEAKILLHSDKVKTLDMLGIATHAGFNSKTTFNTTFKKTTGLTPSQFQKLANASMATR
ncbi:helix-turn-helix domain-containing protein [Cytophagaceae bacterium DM2B3-1]|uniref:Helix-turn-helix domain-containing protein n=1 Tax=Xanthocytophaga flava TaxID=3048013 RepID=A0ABT7CMW3_9BACT|nr:helix-turn-helix domain-containing protein [Xanthocytophaga flavus]MDJ1494019.1 helix-turn-helix domain-containing protein [Xanthocytophaga flavus]